jgi:hypothetical protein
MEEKEYFVLGDKKFAIPSDKVDGFISKYPDAQKAKFYDNVNGKKYYIPLDKVDAFEEKFALKKNEKNQPQEEAITEDSSTVAEPLQESGGEIDFDITTAKYDSETDTRMKGKPQMADLSKDENYKVRKEIFSYTPEKIKETKTEIDNEINSLKEQFGFIREQDKELQEYAKRINQSLLPIQGAGASNVVDRVNKQVLDYESKFENLTEQDRQARDKYNELIQRKSVVEERAAIDEFNEKAEQGNWFGGLYNSLLYGVGEMSAGISSDAIDIMVELMPEKMYGGLTKDEAKKQVKQDLLPYIRKGTKELAGTESTTDEYMQKVSEKNIFTEGIYGLARSAPAMVSPYMSGMYFQIKDGIRQEMELSPELDQMDEWEKQAIQTPIAVAGMFLERFGFSKLAKSTKAATIVTKEALASLPKNATKKQIVDAISQTAQKTGSKLVTGFAAEAETGALQEVTDVGIKKIYNEIKGKELFDTPQTVREFEDNVIRAGVAEGIGGFGTATLTAVSSFMAKGNLGEVTNDAQYELVEQIMSSPEALSAKKKQLKARLDAGKLTDEQYNIEINNIDVASQIVSEIDETLPTEKRRQAFDLITEKKKIQGELAELETKDQDLVSAKVEEKTKKLEEIGVRLKELTESQATPLQKGKRTTAEQYGDKKEVTLKKDLEAQKDEIEKRRQEELSILDAKQAESEKTGEIPTDENGNAIRIKEEKQKINSKYDAELAELAALESNQEVALKKDFEAQKAEIEKRRREKIDENRKNLPVSLLDSNDSTKRNKYKKGEKLTTIKDGKVVFSKSGLIARITIEEDGTVMIRHQGNYQSVGNIKDSNVNEATIRGKIARLGYKDGVFVEQYNHITEDKINAKYDAELKALEQQSTTSNQSTKAKKADIERRRQEVATKIRNEKLKQAQSYLDEQIEKASNLTGDEKIAADERIEEIKSTVEYIADSTDETILNDELDNINNEIEFIKERRKDAYDEFNKAEDKYESLNKVKKFATDVLFGKESRDYKRTKDRLEKIDNELKELESKKEEINNEIQENAKRNESEPMREQGEQKEAEGTVDSDMSEVNETELQDGEKEKIAQEIGKSRKVRAKNIRGLLDVMAGIFGLSKPQAESAAVVGDVIIGNAAKRAGVSKDEMYQIIAFQKSQKAPDGSLKQDAPLTFKSTAKEGIGKIQQTSATPEQWVKQISEKGGKGTSQELEWIGLQDYLNEWKKENNAKSVPKEVVEQYINDNQIEIVEVSKGGQDIRNQREFLEKQQQEALDNEDYEGAEFYERELIKLNEKATEANNEAKYSDLTLEGGENYREVLLTMPIKSQFDKNKIEIKKNKSSQTQGTFDAIYNGDVILEGYDLFLGGRELSDSELKAIAERIYKKGDKFNNIDNKDGAYRSKHWDESNILAHLRLNERTLPNGERVLFIEEVQSDWAQEGKKKGFGDRGKITESDIEIISDEKRYYDWELEGYEHRVEFRVKGFDGTDRVSYNDGNPNEKNITDLKKRLVFDYNKELLGEDRTPDMPYKKTDQWVGMALRRVMQMASQEGFDRIAWVTGEQSAERYSLKEKVNSISVKPNESGRFVFIDMKGNYNVTLNVDDKGKIIEDKNNLNGEQSFAGKQLEDVVGKDMADKILSEKNENKFEGEGLEVGGEGMKAFYNSILPKVAGKEAKRFDKKAKVEVIEVEQKQKDERYNNLIAKRKEFQEKADKSSGYVKDAYLEDIERVDKALEREYKQSKQLSVLITPEMRMNLNSAVPLFQGAQGAMTAADGNYVVYALTNPNVSTPLHELAHIYEHYLTDTERKAIQKWAGTKEWTTETSEKFARGFEKYLAEGKAPTPALQKYFDNFKQWLIDIYNGIVGSEIDIELNEEMRSIYDQMLKEEVTSKQEPQEILKEGDDVTVYKDTYVDGKKTEKRYKAKVVKINDDGTYDLRRGKLVYKNIKPNKISKIKPSKTVDIKKETEGLTEKEVAKQGVEEIVSAYKQKIKDVKRKLNNVIENTKANARDKIKAIDDARKVITQGIEDFLPKEIRVPKNIVKALNSAKTSKQINNTLDRLINFIERAKVSSIKKDIKENQSKVKKILPKLTNKQPLVEEFLSIDLKEVDDIKLLDEINRELENILNQGVAKLNPKLVEDINAKIEKKKLGKSRVITNESFDRRMSLVDEKDSNYSKVKALDGLISDLESTFLNGEIGETDYNRMKSKIESKIDEVSKGLEDDVKELNNDSKERLKNLNENKFTKLQREEIKKLRFMAGKRLDYKNAVKLNDIVTELELGYIPMQQISQYFVDAKSKIDSDVLSEKMNNRKDFGGKLDRVAKFFGLGRQGELRKSKTTQDAIDILQSLNIGFWDDLFGLGKELTFSGLISNPIDKAIATTSRMVRDIERRFVDIKYSAFGGVKDVDDYAIRIARKQGDWEVMEGNDTDYFSELMQNEEEWSKYSQAEQTLIKKAYDKLPKKNGRIAYDVYLENLKGKQKKLNDFYTQIAEELSEYQEITNQRKGKEYKKRDSRYYQTDIVMQDRAKQAEDDLNNFIKSSMGNYVAINAGVGISRVDRTNPVAISLNSERMVARQSTQTLRDYYLSEQINLATKTIGKVKSNLNNKDARIILGQIPEVLRLRLGKEYGIDSNKDAFRRIIHKLLGSARSYYLSGVTRVFGAEIISESIRTLGATRIRQLPRSMAQLIFNNKKVKLNSLKKLLDKTNSPFLEKSYLETSAPDATGELGKARTIGNKAANVVEKITSKYIGLSSTITFPLLWLPEFNYRFKQLTGENFDMSKFTKDDKYYDKYEQDIITSASFADTQTERVQGGRTRFSRRQQVSWIGTPIYNLKDLITGTETTSKTSSQSAPKYLDAFSTAGILNSFLSNFAFLEDLNVSRGGRELIFGENLNRDRAGRLLAFGVLSGMSYNLAKSYIEHLLSDDDDDFWDKDKIIESAINNFMFLKIGRYGQSAKLALLAITSYLVMTEKDNEKKKKIIELSKDRFQSYPIDLGYGSKEYAITNFADQMIPFTGEVIATGLDGVKTIEDSKEDDINPILATISLANDMMKLYLVSKGTQLPTQRYQDDILSALKKIEKGDEITQNEFDVLNKLGFIDIIDDAVNNARVKTE